MTRSTEFILSEVEGLRVILSDGSTTLTIVLSEIEARLKGVEV